MRIVLDAMGSDTYPDPEIQAAIQASQTFGEEIILVGPADRLRTRISELGGASAKIRLVHAPEVLEMTDKPAENARRKAQNSMAIGMELVKSGDADAFVTAGNTGGAMANALFHVGRLRGVKRPGLTGLFPVKGGRCVALDIGANVDCKPEYLLQFAVMGSVYAQHVLGVANPRVGMLSNGEEPGKGNELVKAAYPLLQAGNINFVGNVEGKEIFGGHVDVVVTDGFAGNVMLKCSEAVAKLLVDTLKEQLTSTLRAKLGALLAKPALMGLKKMLDPAEVGAATLLGLDGLVFIGHGRSDARALVSAIRTARQAVEAKLIDHMRVAIQQQLAKSEPQEAA